jgi:hypothetical protein
MSHPSMEGRLPSVVQKRARRGGMWHHSRKCRGHVTSIQCCAIQAFTVLLPSNGPIKSATLPLHACPETSVAQQFLHRAYTPKYFSRITHSVSKHCNSLHVCTAYAGTILLTIWIQGLKLALSRLVWFNTTTFCLNEEGNRTSFLNAAVLRSWNDGQYPKYQYSG